MEDQPKPTLQGKIREFLKRCAASPESRLHDQMARMRAMAQEAKRAYGTEMLAGGEPPYPTWTDDLLAICDAAEQAIQFKLPDLRGIFLSSVAEHTLAERDVLAERRRQIESEGWTPEHDDAHDSGEMAAAGASYALNAADQLHPFSQGDGGNAQPESWPWDSQWWRPTTPRRDLVKAGALILAEIERLDRSASAAVNTD
jgi:hypothetical protein